MPIYNGTLRGKIISKVKGKGTKSEGPEYYLIPEGEYAKWGELLLRKKVMMWQKDPVLHDFVGSNVKIIAEIIETQDTISVDYIKVTKE
ncbi:MAG: hypothetical protein ACTSUV_04970 [Candidatus Ranarchaeia archaeon]